jgi:hypothetical protein
MKAKGKSRKAKRLLAFFIFHFFPLLGIPLCGTFFLVAFSQTNPHFNARLNLNYESAEKTIELYEGSGSARNIVPLKGSQIALATTADLARRRLSAEQLESHLDGIKFGQVSNDDVFLLRDAKQNAGAIKDLLTYIKRRNFGQRVSATVEQLFPADAKISTAIPLYFVAFGHQNIDAYVRRVVWYDNIPNFVGEGEGELTIVVNLAKAIRYGRNVDERFIGVLSVVAHEVFHAAFGAYKDESPTWRAYYASHQSYLDELLDLTQNEGVAHFLTFQQRGDYQPPDWDEKIVASFAEFNRSAEELLAQRITPQRAHILIGTSNTSEYWKSYGAITGMFVARTIDRKLGRRALTETVAAGATEFYVKYILLTEQDDSLPKLSAAIAKHLLRK